MTSQLALGILTVFVGGGSVQLIIFLLKRKAELRSMDATTAATERTSAEPLLKEYGELVGRLRDGEERAQAATTALERRFDEERKAMTASLRTAHSENQRLAKELAQLRTDLDVADRQITSLRRQLQAFDNGH